VSDAGRVGDDLAPQPTRPVPFPDDHTPLYTVGQVADVLGVQPAFLRRLDSEQVVMPARSSGGQRRYSRREIDHIAAIAGLLDEGLTLLGAKRIIELQTQIDELRRQLDERRTP
jgi:MerR family transcriptional regulator, heat shock protein HspR